MNAKVLSYLNPNFESYDNWSDFEKGHTTHKSFSVHELAHNGDVDELKNAVQLLLDQTSYGCLEDGSMEEAFNQESDQGMSPLMEAVANGHFDMVKTLILNGADVNKKCSIGKSPLSKAMELNNDKMIKLLIDNGAY